MGKRCGFTMMEVLIASVILASTIAVLLGLFTQCIKSIQGADNQIKARGAARLGLEMIRARIDPANPSHTISFANLGSWNNQAFQMAQLGNNFIVTAYVSQVLNAPTLIWDVKVVTCWREMGNRILGEDNGAGNLANALNGRLDAGEDQNGNGELDSPAQLETILVQGGI